MMELATALAPKELADKQPKRTVRLGYRSAKTNRVMNSVLRGLFEAAHEIPTIYIDQAGANVVAAYGQSGLEIEVVVLEQALGLSSKAGRPLRLIAPSVQEAISFLAEMEGHRQKTSTPLIRLPNRYAKASRNAPSPR